MFRWFGLVGLRMKTIAVVEREYGRKLEVAGGADTELFNSVTRLARDLDGNEYDAAAIFMVTDAAACLRDGAESWLSMREILMLSTQRLPLMRQPAVVHEVTERALATVADE